MVPARENQADNNLVWKSFWRVLLPQLVLVCDRDESGTGVKFALQLLSRRSVGEKFFHVCLGGLMAGVCPEDGR